jgi:hypothetical protein
MLFRCVCHLLRVEMIKRTTLVGSLPRCTGVLAVQAVLRKHPDLQKYANDCKGLIGRKTKGIPLRRTTRDHDGVRIVPLVPSLRAINRSSRQRFVGCYGSQGELRDNRPTTCSCARHETLRLFPANSPNDRLSVG